MCPSWRMAQNGPCTVVCFFTCVEMVFIHVLMAGESSTKLLAASSLNPLHECRTAETASDTVSSTTKSWLIMGIRSPIHNVQSNIS